MPLFFIGPLIWIVLLILLIAFIASNIVIVPQARAYVIERLGTYRDTWNTGLHFKVPLFERIVRKVTLKEQVVDFPPQPVITADAARAAVRSRLNFFFITTLLLLLENLCFRERLYSLKLVNTSHGLLRASRSHNPSTTFAYHEAYASLLCSWY